MAIKLLSYAVSTLIAAQTESQQDRQVLILARASSGLMRAILPLRLERGSSLVLGGEQPADTETLSVISTTRQAMIDAFNKMQIYLRAQDVPSVSLTLDRLNTAQATMNALRLRIDEALKLPKTQRDATLLPAALKRFQELLDALSATTDAVDAAIPRSDAMLQRYLVLKHAA